MLQNLAAMQCFSLGQWLDRKEGGGESVSALKMIPNEDCASQRLLWTCVYNVSLPSGLGAARSFCFDISKKKWQYWTCHIKQTCLLEESEDVSTLNEGDWKINWGHNNVMKLSVAQFDSLPLWQLTAVCNTSPSTNQSTALFLLGGCDHPIESEQFKEKRKSS